MEPMVVAKSHKCASLLGFLLDDNQLSGMNSARLFYNDVFPMPNTKKGKRSQVIVSSRHKHNINSLVFKDFLYVSGCHATISQRSNGCGSFLTSATSIKQ